LIYFKKKKKLPFSHSYLSSSFFQKKKLNRSRSRSVSSSGSSSESRSRSRSRSRSPAHRKSSHKDKKHKKHKDHKYKSKRDKDRDRDRDRDRDPKEIRDREKDKDKERSRDKDREKDRDKAKDKDREKDRDKDKEREKKEVESKKEEAKKESTKKEPEKNPEATELDEEAARIKRERLEAWRKKRAQEKDVSEQAIDDSLSSSLMDLVGGKTPGSEEKEPEQPTQASPENKSQEEKNIENEQEKAEDDEKDENIPEDQRLTKRKEKGKEKMEDEEMEDASGQAEDDQDAEMADSENQKKWSLEDDEEDDDEAEDPQEEKQREVSEEPELPPSTFAPPTRKMGQTDDENDDDGFGFGSALKNKPKLKIFAAGAPNKAPPVPNAAATSKQTNGSAPKPLANGTPSTAPLKPISLVKENTNEKSKNAPVPVPIPTQAVMEEEEEDPLDAFMVDVDKEVKNLTKMDEDKSKIAKSAPQATGSEKKENEKGKRAGSVERGGGDDDDDDDDEGTEEPLNEEKLLALADKKAKKKDLQMVDHSLVNYEPFNKEFYIEVPEIAKMTPEDLQQLHQELDGIKIRGLNCPKPIKKWAQAGLSLRILEILKKYGFDKPTPIQAQAIPAIMSGRDVIGVAKTGSGKTLAFLLPMFRHIMDQRPVEDGEGTIGLVLTPTRELALQIYSEVKKFSKTLKLRAVCAYGGAPIKDQIADMKRGAEIVVCTPGRMIDLLSANQGRVTNLQRVTYLVLDEADRMFDMGFERR